MTRFLICLVGYFFAIGMGVMVMIFGWGMEPVSWGWIVGGNAAPALVGAMFQLAD